MNYSAYFLTVSMFTITCAGNAYAGGIKESYSYDGAEKKSLIILQVPHVKKSPSYSFLDVDLETNSFGKKYVSGNSGKEFLMAGQKRNDIRTFDYIKVTARPRSYVQHLSYTQYGNLVTYCNNLGAYLFDIKPDVVNVLSAAKGAYEYTNSEFMLRSEAKTILERDIGKLMSRYDKITANVVYVAPTAVVTFENDPKTLSTICPTKPKVFTVEDGNSDAAKVAAGLLPRADPTGL